MEPFCKSASEQTMDFSVSNLCLATCGQTIEVTAGGNVAGLPFLRKVHFMAGVVVLLLQVEKERESAECTNALLLCLFRHLVALRGRALTDCWLRVSLALCDRQR